MLGRHAALSVGEEINAGLGFYWLVQMVRSQRGEVTMCVRETMQTLGVVIYTSVEKVRGCFFSFFFLPVLDS